MDSINVKIIIDEWDPIALLSHAPDDEYHSEICVIEQLLKSTTDTNTLALGIYDVFTRAFGDDVFTKTQSECVVIAQKILRRCLGDGAIDTFSSHSQRL